MNSDGRKILIRRLRRGKAVRAQFVASHMAKGVAFQIRAIRDRLKLSQEQLAAEVGMTQNAISRLESPDYGKPTLTTLRRLAAAFDVGLIVRFVPFSELGDWVSGTPRVNEGLSGESLAIPGFDAEEEAGVFDIEAPARYWAIFDGNAGLDEDAPHFTPIGGELEFTGPGLPTGDFPSERKPVVSQAPPIGQPITTGEGVRQAIL
jgi:transcriptional regulator with XRE-family HTH domain